MILLSYWIGLHAADTALTLLGLDLGAIEGNPLLNMVAEHIGYLSTLLGKVLVAGVIGFIVWRLRKRHMLAVMNYAMVCTVVFNMLVITYAL